MKTQAGYPVILPEYWRLRYNTVKTCLLTLWAEDDCNSFKTCSIQVKTFGRKLYTVFNIQFKHTLPKNKLKLQFDIRSSLEVANRDFMQIWREDIWLCFSLVTVLKFLIFTAKFIYLLLTFNEAKSGSLEEWPMGLRIFSLKLQTQKIWKFKKKRGERDKG